MEVEVKKIYLGKYVSVRDYLVKRAKERDEDLIIRHGEDFMIVKNINLDKGLKDTHNQHSKFGGEYQLIDFEWKPVKKVAVHEGQEGLF